MITDFVKLFTYFMRKHNKHVVIEYKKGGQFLFFRVNITMKIQWILNLLTISQHEVQF